MTNNERDELAKTLRRISTRIEWEVAILLGPVRFPEREVKYIAALEELEILAREIEFRRGTVT
jgi:hypothetical protein